MRKRSVTLEELAKYLDKQANGIEWKIQFNKELLALVAEGKVFAERIDGDDFRFMRNER